MTIEEAGRSALLAAEGLWAKGLRDGPRATPEDLQAIAALIAGGLDRQIRPYQPGQYPWCGAFFAWCWAQVFLKRAIRHSWTASTYRLFRLFSGQSLGIEGRDLANPKPDEGRRLWQVIHERTRPTDLLFRPLPGMLLLVGRGHPIYGTHVTMIREWDEPNWRFRTVAGNGHGEIPGGASGPEWGVVHADFPLGPTLAGRYRACAIGMPALGDLEPP